MVGDKAIELIIPIRPDKYVRLEAEFPMTDEEWERMIAILGAMKPALVEGVSN